jgi:hypothetical protein
LESEREREKRNAPCCDIFDMHYQTHHFLTFVNNQAFI